MNFLNRSFADGETRFKKTNLEEKVLWTITARRSKALLRVIAIAWSHLARIKYVEKETEFSCFSNMLAKLLSKVFKIIKQAN